MRNTKCTAARFTTAVTGKIMLSAGSVACNHHQLQQITDFCGIRFEIYENILIVNSCGGVRV